MPESRFAQTLHDFPQSNAPLSKADGYSPYPVLPNISVSNTTLLVFYALAAHQLNHLSLKTRKGRPFPHGVPLSNPVNILQGANRTPQWRLAAASFAPPPIPPMSHHIRAYFLPTGCWSMARTRRIKAEGELGRISAEPRIGWRKEHFERDLGCRTRK